MNQLIIIGASGHGKVAADIAKRIGYEDIVFLDDNPDITCCGKYPVIGKTSEIVDSFEKLFLAIGNAEIRERLMTEIGIERFVTLIHPSAIVAEDVYVGTGSIIMAGSVINPGTRIGTGCIVNTSSSIDHDCFLENYVHVSVGSHLSGTVRIGNRTWVGAGATISNNINISHDCVIGAGAVVIKDLKTPGTYVGIPARRIR